MTSTSKSKKYNPSRSTARLLAVQALYEMDATGIESGPVIKEFADKRWENILTLDDDNIGSTPEKLKKPNHEFMIQIIEGMWANRQTVDALINDRLNGEWTVPRLEAVLRAILRAGTYELDQVLDIPARVVVNEYVQIADAFFDGSEVKLANAVLDKLAHDLRPDEMTVKSTAPVPNQEQ